MGGGWWMYVQQNRGWKVRGAETRPLHTDGAGAAHALPNSHSQQSSEP